MHPHVKERSVQPALKWSRQWSQEDEMEVPALAV
jgi:hypothetical protein